MRPRLTRIIGRERDDFGFPRAHIASLAHFWALRVRALLPRHVFRLLACAHGFPRHVFGLCACAHGFPSTFSGKVRAHFASPAHFRASRACALLPLRIASPEHFQPLGAFPRLPQRIFSLWEHSHGFPGVFSAFGSAPTTSPAHLSQGKALLTSFPEENSPGFSRLRTASLACLSQGGAVLCRSAMRCLQFSCENSCRFVAKGTKIRVRALSRLF